MSGWVVAISIGALWIYGLLILWGNKEDYDHKLEITNSLDKKSLRFEQIKPKKLSIRKKK